MATLLSRSIASIWCTLFASTIAIGAESTQNVQHGNASIISGHYNVVIQINAGPTKLSVCLIDSPHRAEIADSFFKLLPSKNLNRPVEKVPGSWEEYCDNFKSRGISVVIVHWHTLAPPDKILKKLPKDKQVEARHNAEDRLLAGIAKIAADSPETRFVVYSRSFGDEDEDNMNLIGVALTRSKKIPDSVRDRITPARLSSTPTKDERKIFLQKVAMQIGSWIVELTQVQLPD